MFRPCAIKSSLALLMKTSSQFAPPRAGCLLLSTGISAKSFAFRQNRALASSFWTLAREQVRSDCWTACEILYSSHRQDVRGSLWIVEPGRVRIHLRSD